MASEHFDPVIVGSGLGGSVTSYRLAEAGLDVCVLERGKAYPPGYGHLDMFMGKNAYRDVYPKMVEELDQDN